MHNHRLPVRRMFDISSRPFILCSQTAHFLLLRKNLLRTSQGAGTNNFIAMKILPCGRLESQSKGSSKWLT
jgi:hypothetical protein